VRRALGASLRRLATDWIAVYLLHLAVLPIDQAAALTATLDDLVDEGRIHTYGWSSDDVDRVASWAGRPRCAATEFELNMLNDAPALVDLCEANDLLGLYRGPLAMGLLGGRYDTGTQIGADDVRSRRAPDGMRWFRDGRDTGRNARRHR
jgi:aryl-alcohol dehydrogenase-like predicted oxidoreductase